MSQKAALNLPRHYRRWVSDAAAPTFEAAAKLRTFELSPPGRDEVLITLPPRHDEYEQVLVRTAFATVNAGHSTFIARREGFWKDSIGVQNLGADGMGEVVAIGDDVRRFQIGDYVTCVFCASFSEYVTPKEMNCVKISSLNPGYAAVRVGGTYSCGLIEQILCIESGRSVLITAACGGVGHVLVQVAKVHGAHVIGTCGGPNKKEKVLELGADRVIDYTNESVDEVLTREYPNGIDYAIDGVGGELLKTTFDHLAPGGKVAVIGYDDAA